MKLEVQGLTSTQVKKLREKYGNNEIIKGKKTRPLGKFLSVFKEPMFFLLMIISTIYFMLGQFQDGMIMLFFVIFVSGITFVQEWKTEKTVNALKALTSPKVKVLRDGMVTTIESRELVPGDIVYIYEGERVPADCEAIEASNFYVDESVLTGESESVLKEPESSIADEGEEENSYWKHTMVYAGTLVSSGTCMARVSCIGRDTEYGKIGKSMESVKESRTPLQKKVNKMVKTMALIGVILCAAVGGLSYIYSGDIIYSIIAGITLAMGMIPEEFPLVLTVFSSMGAYRLAKKNALMRRITAVEGLGSVTVLCVDKTGTITENNMRALEVYSKGRLMNIEDFHDKDLSRLFIASCEENPYDPMEKAIINAARENTFSEEVYSHEIIYKESFDSKTKRMANVYEDEGKFYACLKGSFEAVAVMCGMDYDERKMAEDAMNDMAERGLRVIAFAEGVSEEAFYDISEYPMEFKGLIGLKDPPKKGVEEAVRKCRRAGIKVVMITGDYNRTAMAVGREIGLSNPDKVICGVDIDKMKDDELKEAVKGCSIFSRVIPEHKMRIVNAFKASGETVAMTGDGVNDAPALKAADIGISMGKRGTDVAKEASSMILMDDNFTTIVDSVEDGRRIYDNIRKAMVYIIIAHIPIAILSIIAPLCGIPQILMPMHIVMLELIIDPTCSIVFENEPAEGNVMEVLPRSPKEPLVTKGFFIRALFQGCAISMAVFLSFFFMIKSGMAEAYSRSFALTVLIVANVNLVLENRSNSMYLIHLFKEKAQMDRLFVNGAALLFLIAVIYVPFLQGFFKTEALGSAAFFWAAFIGSVSVVWWEIVKWASKRHDVKKD